MAPRPAACYFPPGTSGGTAGVDVVSNIYTVFLSSTRKDLVAYREAAATAINKVPEFKCVGMEDFGAVDGDAASYCPAAVQDCDVFVILLGLCYGSRPASGQPSYTEAEYDAAKNANRPRLAFFAPDNFHVPRDLTITDYRENGDAQDRFRQRVLNERVAARFDTPETLANEIVLALHRWVRQEDRRIADKTSVPLSGIGVLDTTSLSAASDYLESGDDTRKVRHPNREWIASTKEYFLSLLHHLILYDELRTDSAVLNIEPGRYADLVRDLLLKLSADVTVSPMPETLDEGELSSTLTTVFVAKVREGLARGNIDILSHLRQSRLESDDQPGLMDDESITQHFYARIGEANTRDLIALGDIIKATTGLVISHSHLTRTASILVRSAKYAAHANYLKQSMHRPAAYCAAPGRLDVMRRYLANSELSSIEFAARGFIDLMARLGLPSGGYNFSIFAGNFNPLPYTELSDAVAHLPPVEALARTLDLRKQQAAAKIRADWAERLWAQRQTTAEGVSLDIRNATVRGKPTVIQYVATQEPLSDYRAEQSIVDASASQNLTQTILAGAAQETSELKRSLLTAFAAK